MGIVPGRFFNLFCRFSKNLFSEVFSRKPSPAWIFLLYCFQGCGRRRSNRFFARRCFCISLCVSRKGRTFMAKLLAFDLDGTTITEHKYLSEGNRTALLEAAERGVILVPATGRMKSFLPEEITNLLGVRYAVTSNGAAVYDLWEDRAVYQRLIPHEKARQVQKILEEYDIFVEYYRDGEAITKAGYPGLAKTHFGFPRSKWHFVDNKKYTFTDNLETMLEETRLCPEKINLPYLREDIRREIWGRLEALGGLRLTSSIPDNIEVNDENAHKGAALLVLAARLGVSQEDIMAVGDNGNDVTMLEAAGCSVAVGDGSPEALAAAKHITAPHDRDGLAQAVEAYLHGDMI